MYQYIIIVVLWFSRVYGICTLRAVTCIPEGAGQGKIYNYMKSTNPYTLETHGTGDLCHNKLYTLQCMDSSKCAARVHVLAIHRCLSTRGRL